MWGLRFPCLRFWKVVEGSRLEGCGLQGEVKLGSVWLLSRYLVVGEKENFTAAALAVRKNRRSRIYFSSRLVSPFGSALRLRAKTPAVEAAASARSRYFEINALASSGSSSVFRK